VETDPAKGLALGIPVLTLISFLLFMGATGKSAQLPLYMWLPDAMEGPTPVSALIHAATMVTAGVYMVARSAALFSRAPMVEMFIVIIATVTMLFAGLIALTQYDIKRVLAYSTVSQLGYMFVAVGVGSYASGSFHLVTHAFFKACLFLGAGSVMHALGGELDMRKMGGLAKKMPITYWTFAVSTAAIAGVVFFSGFYSKDAIIHAAMGYNKTIGWLTLVGALLTAGYMGRLLWTVFCGKTRFDPALASHADHGRHASPGDAHDEGHGHSLEPHESPPVMTIPLVILAFFALVAGVWLGGQIWPPPDDPALGRYLAGSLSDAAPTAAHAPVGHWIPFVSIAACFLGLGAAWMGFTRGLFARGWGNALWARVVNARFGYDGLMHAIFVRGGTALCNLTSVIADQWIVDGIVNGIAALVARLAGGLRQLQTGFVRNYALVLLTGAVFVIVCLMWTVQVR